MMTILILLLIALCYITLAYPKELMLTLFLILCLIYPQLLLISILTVFAAITAVIFKVDEVLIEMMETVSDAINEMLEVLR